MVNKKDALVIEMISRGLNPTQIAKEMHTTAGAISVRIYRIRKSGVKIPRFRSVANLQEFERLRSVAAEPGSLLEQLAELNKRVNSLESTIYGEK